MGVKVRIPTPLRQLTQGQAVITVEGNNVAELLEAMEAQYAGFKQRLYDDQSNLRRFISVFVNTEDIRNLQGLETPVRAGDELTIIPAIAGG
jgi:molybdopterin synthase sulfur carrier subunit